MMIEKLFENLYNQSNQVYQSFGLFDSFSWAKRKLLKKEIDNVITTISKNNFSKEEIQQFKKLRLQLIKKYQGGALSNAFIKVFHPKANFSAKALKVREKKLDKLEKAGVEPRYFPSIIGKSKQTQKLDHLLFENYIFQRMEYFGHPSTFNDKGEMTFKYTETKFVKDIVANKKKVEWEKLRQEWSQKGIFLEVKGNFKEGCFRTVAVENLTPKQFKQVMLTKGKVNPNVKIVYPTKYLTTKQLIKKEIIDKEGNIRSAFTYTGNGFTKTPEHWSQLTPIDYTNQPPEKFTLELIVHTKGKRANITSNDLNYGHVSLKMTTPNGEIYSMGFYPSEDIDVLKSGIKLQKGDFEYLDHSIFLPSSAYTHNNLGYTFPDDKSFHQFMKWIAAMKGDDENNWESSNLFYHYTHHNCATFGQAARDYALQLGAKAETWDKRKLADWTTIGFKIKKAMFKLFLNFVLYSPLGHFVLKWQEGLEHAEIKNFNIRHLGKQKATLPADLIAEHIAIWKKQNAPAA